MEECHLEVTGATFHMHKKMILDDIHRLWIYYICQVADLTAVNNAEPEKHNFCGFVPLDQLPDMWDTDVINAL